MSDEHATAAVSWRIALDRFVTAIRSVYGTRVHSFVLYGSRARGDAELGSDIDILVILDHIADFWSEHRRISDLAWQASEDAEAIVSALPMSRVDFEERRSPLLLNVRREGVALDER